MSWAYWNGCLFEIQEVVCSDSTGSGLLVKPPADADVAWPDPGMLELTNGRADCIWVPIECVVDTKAEMQARLALWKLAQ